LLACLLACLIGWLLGWMVGCFCFAPSQKDKHIVENIETTVILRNNQLNKRSTDARMVYRQVVSGLVWFGLVWFGFFGISVCLINASARG
jgi:hypothetical protein